MKFRRCSGNRAGPEGGLRNGGEPAHRACACADRMAELAVKEGDHVEPGQVVATAGDEKLALQLKSLGAQIAGLEAQLARAQADLARRRRAVH
jgi:hypothetical protein